ncbi:hypothetical protein C7974DRAFT_397475 [Boeremia exigua]|uniref:uncharacterized protein n=1 Tax=Boeremia exigua TaxID=749465 RepID=UPI001E8CE450|nr:uncharacterized protein C7974DRAFT_397475 [Boeremia exigua]KAH6621988.1 hypothetical protein C7974DRAFT_397475 [Boeremia exigua]
MPERRSRISTACVACRARKHRCSGGKPRCDQCNSNDLPCEWPTQQKRGPPKQYIHNLEARLMQTENVLLALLSEISIEQLEASFQQTPLSGTHNPGLSEHQTELNPVSLSMSRKEASTWTHFPLDSPENVRRWWQHKASLISRSLATSSVGDKSPMLVEGNSPDMIPSTGLYLIPEAETDIGPTVPFVSDSGPQSFEVGASYANTSNLTFMTGNENGMDYTGRFEHNIGGPQGNTSQPTASTEGVLRLSEEFKQDFIW